jgi:hypothetical protein
MALLRTGALPPAAQRAAAHNRDLRSALATAGSDMDLEAWRTAYTGDLPADVAESLAWASPDSSCVEHVLLLKEKRAKPLRALFTRWLPTPDQQLRFASMAIAAGAADALVESPWVTDEAKAKVARRCDHATRLWWACSAPSNVDDDTLVEHVAAALARDTREPDITTASNLVAQLCFLRPGCIDKMMEVNDHRALVGLSMIPLEAAAGDTGEPTLGQADLFSTMEPTGDRWERLWNLVKDDRLANSHVQENLLARPDVPHNLKQAIWDDLPLESQGHILGVGIPSPTAAFGRETRVGDITDARVIEHLLVGDPRSGTTTRMWVWCELAYSDHLDERLARLLHQRLNDLYWRRPDAVTDAMAMLEQRWSIHESACVETRRKQQELSVEQLEQFARGDGPAAQAQRSSGYRMSYTSAQAYNDPAKMPVGPRVQEAQATRTGGYYSSGGPFGGRPDQAAEWLADKLGDNQAAWELLYSFVEEFDGPLDELAEMTLTVAGVADTATV